MKRLLLSLDPEQNRFRFFTVEVVLRDDGRAELRKRWGRVGSHGRMDVEVFPHPDDAQAEHDRLLARRQRRGYQLADARALHRARRLLAWHRARRRTPRQLPFSDALGF